MKNIKYYVTCVRVLNFFSYFSEKKFIRASFFCCELQDLKNHFLSSMFRPSRCYSYFIANIKLTRIESIPRSSAGLDRCVYCSYLLKIFKGTFFELNELENVINIGIARLFSRKFQICPGNKFS